MWHWFVYHFTGAANPGGVPYNLWSGFLSALLGMTVVGSLAALIVRLARHHAQRLAQVAAHHKAQMAQAERHHTEKLAQAQRHHDALKQHISDHLGG